LKYQEITKITTQKAKETEINTGADTYTAYVTKIAA